MPSQDELTSWNATNWDELRQVWSELIGADSANSALGSTNPKFRNQEVSDSQAGYVFQTWIIEAFRLSGIEIDRPFRVPTAPGINEQTLAELDGFVVIDNHRFIIESKFQRLDFDPIARLHLLVEQRPVGTMGLLFATEGYTRPAIDSAHILRPIRVLLFARDDIDFIARSGDIGTAVRVKWKRAVMFGRPNLPVEP